MRERYARLAVAALFFGYAFSIRVYDIADTFLMLGEQTRDWIIALGGASELPLTGAPSTAGGRGFGPAYYWILWLGRVIVGPFAGTLPHVGGLIIAALQAGATTWLLLALWRRVGALLALAVCLLIASAPFDVAISSVIWNPPVAAALVKMAMAMALGLGDTPPRWKIAVTVMLAWMAVQAHLSAIFVTAPLLVALAARPLWPGARGGQERAGQQRAGLKSGPYIPEDFRSGQSSDRPDPSPERSGRSLDRPAVREAAATAALIAAVILVLQIPYLLALVHDPAAPAGPTTAISTMANAEAFRIDRSYTAIVNSAGELLVRQFDGWRFEIPTLVAAIIVLARYRRDPVLLAVTVGALAGASVVFATWTRGYDSYWFLTLAPALALTFGMAVAALPWKPAVQAAGGVVLAFLVWLQPARIEQSTVFFKYPQYRAMRIASSQLAGTAPVLRDIRLEFEAHPTMDKYFIYRILGGRIEPDAPRQAFVAADGSVRIE